MRRVPRAAVIGAEILVAVAIAWFAWRALRAQWEEVGRVAANVRPDWLLLGLATILVR